MKALGQKLNSMNEYDQGKTSDCTQMVDDKIMQQIRPLFQSLVADSDRFHTVHRKLWTHIKALEDMVKDVIAGDLDSIPEDMEHGRASERGPQPSSL